MNKYLFAVDLYNVREKKETNKQKKKKKKKP